MTDEKDIYEDLLSTKVAHQDSIMAKVLQENGSFKKEEIELPCKHDGFWFSQEYGTIGSWLVSFDNEHWYYFYRDWDKLNEEQQKIVNKEFTFH